LAGVRFALGPTRRRPPLPSARSRALATEAKYVSEEVAQRTDGTVRLTPEEVAASDRTRFDEMSKHMRVDGVPLEDHPSVWQWMRGDERVQLPSDVAARLGINADATISDVIAAVKRSRL